MDIEQMKKDLGGGNVFPIGEENVAFAKYFTGECYLNMLTTERVPVGLVTFAPGTINAYHIHHKGGQILLVTGGRGWYQEEGKPARELKAGDVVNISPEVKHWHGAAKDSWFQHLAVEVPAEGASNEWLPPPQSLVVASFNGIHICALCESFLTSSFYQVIFLFLPRSKPLLQG